MPKMTDQEFDNLFRQAANRISPEQQPGDWDDMQRRLEVAERDARARNISLYSMLVLLLLYSFVVPDNLKSRRSEQASVLPQVEEVEQAVSTEGISADNASTSRITAAAEQQTSPGKESQQEADGDVSRLPEFADPDYDAKAAPDTSSGEDNSGADEVNTNTAVRNITKDKAANASGSAHPQRLEPGEALRRDRQGKHERTQADAVTGGSAIAIQSLSSDGNGKAGDVTQSRERADQTQGNDAVNSAQHVASSSAQTQLTTVAPTAFNQSWPRQEMSNSGEAHAAAVHSKDFPSTEPLFVDPTLRAQRLTLKAPGVVVAPPDPATLHPLFVRIAVSPDFSSIDYGSAGKTGLNFGPMFEYGLSPRFSVSTGAIWSKKLYDQKNPGKTYGQGTGYPAYANMLNGDCRILDIPLNLTYYMLPGRKTNLFVTVGSSSYIMLEEEYVYTVRHNNKDYEYVESYANKNNEWFSMLNLSFGVQHQVARRWFVQGEPFLKAPMKGVGEGKVNLVSAGVFVSVKYWINP